MMRFRREAESVAGRALPDYDALWHWSVDRPAAFWSLMWRFGHVIGEAGGRVLVDGGKMPGAAFFPDARLNYAENLLRRNDDAIALIHRCEDQGRSEWTFATLHRTVSRLAQAMRAAGLQAGDRVAAFTPDTPEAIATMLAATSIGAIWSSCSPDFGTAGVVDRFGQIEPKLLIACDGYRYAGKDIDTRQRLAEIVAGLPSVEKTIVVPQTYMPARDISMIPRAQGLADFMAPPYRPGPIEFVRLPFDHPLFILYSSGTTGKPKCIVHGAGGTLLQHLKEHRLHTDIGVEDRLFYFTTCGWMMWNWQVSALALGATLLLHDGSPFHPGPQTLFDYADADGMTVFGTSAKYIDTLAKAGLKPRKTHRLTGLKAMLSTGSPLSPENFRFVYRDIKADLCLSSISGGTDIISCFALGNPAGPVWAGELQVPGLGMNIAVVDDDGDPVLGEKGELVCRSPFPSMPVGFWNDPEGSRYRATYFERYPGIWYHGDYAEQTRHGGLVIHGRSDTVLNPGGVRIGTAEIYRQVEQVPEVMDSLVIGQDWDNDVRVVLFVQLRPGLCLDDALTDRIKGHIRRNASPRHVPARIVQVVDIPRTRSGKISEYAVREIVHGRPVKNVEALANPDTLNLFRDLAALKS